VQHLDSQAGFFVVREAFGYLILLCFHILRLHLFDRFSFVQVQDQLATQGRLEMIAFVLHRVQQLCRFEELWNQS